MRWLFWLCFLGIAYAYLGYALLLWVQSRLRTRSVAQAVLEPAVSVVIAARNEAANLEAKLESLSRLEYPKDKLEIVIVSDGSTDGTAQFLKDHSYELAGVILDRSHGKANALNQAVKRSTGEILVFLDARQSVDPQAIRNLVQCFADPEVGAVSGELLLEDSTGKGSSEGLGIYWRIEKLVRKLESASGSVVGVTGAIYALRRELYDEIPAGTILDDVYVPMQVALRRKRVIFEPTAIARDRLFGEKGKEFSRKVRTLTGNYQLLRLAPWLLTPANPLLFRFVSHKLMRLLVPLLLIVMFVASARVHTPFYRTVFCLQAAFYALAACGMLVPRAKKLPPVAIANTFVMLNAAAALAFYNFITGKKSVWV